MAPGGNLGRDVGSLKPAHIEDGVTFNAITTGVIHGLPNVSMPDGGLNVANDINSNGVVSAASRLLAQQGTVLGNTQNPGYAGALYTGAGAPVAGQGNNGDYYFRQDTPGTVNQRVYVKSAGAWVGII
jgi:hypothetical protein